MPRDPRWPGVRAWWGPRERPHLPPLPRGSHQWLAGLTLLMLPAPGTPGRPPLPSSQRVVPPWPGSHPVVPSSLLGQRLGPWVRGPRCAGVLTLHRGPVHTHGEAHGSPPLPAQPDRPPPGRPTAAVASLGSHPGLDPRHQRAHARGASPASWGGGAVSHVCGPAQPWKEPEGKVPEVPGGLGRRG